MLSFQTLFKETFRLLTCYLLFRPQNSPYFLRKPRTRDSRTNGLEQAGSVFGDLFLPMVFHRQSKRVKIFSETFVTKYLYKRDYNT